MQKIGLKGKMHLGLHTSQSQERVINYYKGMTRSMIMRVYKAYEEDFQIFGYRIGREVWESLGPEHSWDRKADLRNLDVYTDWKN